MIWGDCKFTYLAFSCAITFSLFPTSVSSLLYLVLLYIISLLIWKSKFPGIPSQVHANLPLSPVPNQMHPVRSSHPEPLRYLRASPAFLWALNPFGRKEQKPPAGTDPNETARYLQLLRPEVRGPPLRLKDANGLPKKGPIWNSKVTELLEIPSVRGAYSTSSLSSLHGCFASCCQNCSSCEYTAAFPSK